MDLSRSAVRELTKPTATGRDARLELVFGYKSGRTVIRDHYAEVPFKITRLYHPDQSSLAQLIIMNTTPGLFPGDRLSIRIRVEAGARVLVTSQSSTKLHPGDGVAEQCLQVDVEPDAELHIYNDPLIPFRGSRLHQRVRLNVAENTIFRFWDGFMAGRIHRGESWEFEEIDSETRVIRNGRLLYLDHYRLNATSAKPDIQYFATGIFHESIPPAFLECNGVSVGVDEPEPGLAIVRAVAQTGVEYRNIQQRILTRAFECRNQKMPDLRKY